MIARRTLSRGIRSSIAIRQRDSRIADANLVAQLFSHTTTIAADDGSRPLAISVRSASLSRSNCESVICPKTSETLSSASSTIEVFPSASFRTNARSMTCTVPLACRSVKAGVTPVSNSLPSNAMTATSTGPIFSDCSVPDIRAHPQHDAVTTNVTLRVRSHAQRAPRRCIAGDGILGAMSLEVSVRGTIIPAEELTWRFSRSGGPGGQSVNTADTRVELGYDLAASAALPQPLKERAMRALAGRLTNGVLVVVSSESRSQLRNREAAAARLSGLLTEATAPPGRPRRPTKPSRASVERRLAAKQRRAKTKRLRRSTEE